MKQEYREINFRTKARTLIGQANDILEEYDAQGFTMTLRQLFYQFVARDMIENAYKNYKLLGRTVSNGRIAGLIDWDHIEDRTRSLNTHSSWRSPESIIRTAATSYREDIWQGQKYRPEVWIEKAALIGVIEGVCNEFRVPYFACIGNNSQSEQRKAGERFSNHKARGLIPVVLHFADHDANGIDMSRDNRERLAVFAGADIEVRRLGLNMDQVRKYNLPPNFAKEKDNNIDKYVAEFGTVECWELDALSPPVIEGLIRDELNMMIDHDEWKDREAEEQENRDLLAKVSANWPRVKKAVGA
jgi:hypothetical protein